ncbi:MAG: glycosyltransferase family 2 protein [Lachnospiraceae bacterium]
MKTVEMIVPCYNEEECIALFYARVCEVFENLKEHRFIITYIDDGSKDGTLDEIKKLVKTAEKGRVQYLSFSRNFGKEAAIYAGLSKSTGDYVTIMDADLQHPPELLADMLEAIEKEGYDCASARRISRKGEPPVRSAFSKAFYRLISKVTAIELVPGSTDYRLMKRKVVEAVVSMPEYERFTKGLYAWAGYKNKWIEYKNVERAGGKSKWSFWGLLRYAYSGFISFATTPLRGVVYVGILTVLASIAGAIYILIGAINSGGDNRTGYASIMILMLFLGGVIITILGMIGEYLARIYMEVKRRPIYFERESNIDKEEGKEDSEE